MKIVRFLTVSKRPTYGVWDEDQVRLIAGDPFGVWAVSDTTLRLEQVTLILPPCAPPNIVGIPINFAQTAREQGVPVPERIQPFWQATTSLTGRDRPLIIPKGVAQPVRYHVQLGLILRSTLFEAGENEVRAGLLGYTGAISLFVPDDEDETGPAWGRGHSYDSTTSIGPFLQSETDPDQVEIQCRLNGETVACANSSDFLFSCRKLVSHLSHRYTLRAGTLVLTGPVPFLPEEEEVRRTVREGDILEVEVEGVGTLSNPVVAA